MKKILALVFVLVLAVSLAALAKTLDPGYVKAFGWGSICASVNGVPEKDKFDASQFDYDKTGKVFYVKGGPGARLDLRAILPQGKVYSDYMAILKKKKSALLKNHKWDYLAWYTWTSHDSVGNQLSDKWPSKPGELPGWKETNWMRLNYGQANSWNGSYLGWDDSQAPEFKTDLNNWLEKAQPGWKLYVVHTIGFERSCPELARVGQNVGTGIIENQVPISFEDYEPPLATCTIIVK
ncbi:MAG: hypothetical protein V2A78_06600 [bacterium]